MNLIKYFLLFLFFSFTPVHSDNTEDFKKWKNNFKKIALQNDISEHTFDTVMQDIKFLPRCH